MHSVAEGNQCTLIREKTLEFSLTVLPTLSLHLKSWSSSQKNALSVLDLQNVHRKGDAINKYSVSCKRYSNAMLSVVPETSTIQWQILDVVKFQQSMVHNLIANDDIILQSITKYWRLCSFWKNHTGISQTTFYIILLYSIPILVPVQHTHTHTHLTALFPVLPRWASTRKVKLIWILLKQETVSSSGISWVICKSAPHSRQITTPAPHQSVFYRPDALPAAQPTASKHWRLCSACTK